LCSFFCFPIGLVLALLGGWATQQYFRFTPVYTDIECTFDVPDLQGFSFRGGFHVNLTLNVSCDNPNPYSVNVSMPNQLHVYAGKNINPVATVTDLPHAILPAHGVGSIVAHGSIAPTRQTLGTATGALFGGQIPLWVEIELDVHVELDFIFGNFSTTVPFVKDCGLMAQFYSIGGTNVGNLACADSFDDLHLTKIDRSRDAATKPQPLTLLDRTLMDAERAKTTGLGTLMGCLYGSALPILVVSSWYLYKLGWCCSCGCCYEEEEEEEPARRRPSSSKSTGRHKPDKARSRAESRYHEEEAEKKMQV